MTDIIGTYDALVSNLLNATLTEIDVSADIAWDNAEFNPSGKSAWLDTYYVPVLADNTSKTSAGQYQDGYFQISVYVPLNDGTDDAPLYARREMTLTSEILTTFATNKQILYNNVTVEILDSSFTAPVKSSGWWTRNITINYKRLGA